MIDRTHTSINLNYRTIEKKFQKKKERKFVKEQIENVRNEKYTLLNNFHE